MPPRKPLVVVSAPMVSSNNAGAPLLPAVRASPKAERSPKVVGKRKSAPDDESRAVDSENEAPIVESAKEDDTLKAKKKSKFTLAVKPMDQASGSSTMVSKPQAKAKHADENADVQLAQAVAKVDVKSIKKKKQMLTPVVAAEDDSSEDKPKKAKKEKKDKKSKGKEDEGNDKKKRKKDKEAPAAGMRKMSATEIARQEKFFAAEHIRIVSTKKYSVADFVRYTDLHSLEQSSAIASKAKDVKPERDPNMPKKPLSAYMLFSKEQQAHFKQENPALKMGDLAKKVGEAWRALGDPGQKVVVKYKDQYATAQTAFNQQMEAYKAKGGSGFSAQSSSSSFQTATDGDAVMEPSSESVAVKSSVAAEPANRDGSIDGDDDGADDAAAEDADDDPEAEAEDSASEDKDE